MNAQLIWYQDFFENELGETFRSFGRSPAAPSAWTLFDYHVQDLFKAKAIIHEIRECLGWLGSNVVPNTGHVFAYLNDAVLGNSGELVRVTV
eukprot:jgi/Psemu1/22844/gm1.22844_g